MEVCTFTYYLVKYLGTYDSKYRGGMFLMLVFKKAWPTQTRTISSLGYKCIFKVTMAKYSEWVSTYLHTVHIYGICIILIHVKHMWTYTCMQM